MNNKQNKPRVSYKKYKRRQRLLAVFLLLVATLLVSLGFVVGYNSKESYTVYHLPSDPEVTTDNIFPEDNEHKCSIHTHQVYDEVVSFEDGTVLHTSSCIEVKEVESSDSCDTDEADDSNATNLYVQLTAAEKHELACLIYLEGRGESIKCQEAIGSVVLNRYTTGNYSSLKDVIHAKGQFTPAALIKDTTPTVTQIQIVDDLCMNGPTIPEYVTYFRADKYHTWTSTEPYIQIDNTFFSADKKLRQAL